MEAQKIASQVLETQDIKVDESEIEVLSGENVVSDDGHAKLVFCNDVGLENEVQGKWIGLTMADPGGFTCLCIPVEEWSKIKKRVDSLIRRRDNSSIKKSDFGTINDLKIQNLVLRKRNEEAAEREDEAEKRTYANIIHFFRDVKSPCKECLGLGKKRYHDTSTWRHGIGGQALTIDVCDNCWGSGDEDKKWPEWKK